MLDGSSLQRTKFSSVFTLPKSVRDEYLIIIIITITITLSVHFHSYILSDMKDALC